MKKIKCFQCCFRKRLYCQQWNITIDNIYQNGCGDGIDLSQYEGGDENVIHRTHQMDDRMAITGIDS